jgi:hypothetical protein
VQQHRILITASVDVGLLKNRSQHADQDLSAESAVGHLTACRWYARQSLNRRRKVPGGLAYRHSRDGLADLRIVDEQISNPETLRADDAELQLQCTDLLPADDRQ